MRILQVMTELRPAGAERIVQLLATGLRAAGHELLVVALQPPPDESFIVESLQDAGIAVRSLGVRKTTPWRLLRLRKIIAEFQPHVIHSHLFHANLLTRLCQSGDAPVLINTVHIAERRPEKFWQFWLDRLTWRRCHCQTAVSNAVARYHTQRLRMPLASMPVIYNGIEPILPLSAAERLAWRRQWGVADCARVIGSVGRLEPQKGYDRLFALLAALDELVPAAERWAVVVIGSGQQHRQLQQIADRTYRRLVVKLPGFVPDANRAAGAFDLFVMPSRYEGFGLTLAEAMMHGLPAIVSNVDSLPELLHVYGYGETVDFGVATDVLAAIQHWIKLPPTGQAAPFCSQQMIQAYLRLYRDFTDRATV